MNTNPTRQARTMRRAELLAAIAAVLAGKPSETHRRLLVGSTPGEVHEAVLHQLAAKS